MLSVRISLTTANWCHHRLRSVGSWARLPTEVGKAGALSGPDRCHPLALVEVTSFARELANASHAGAARLLKDFAW